MFIKYVKDILLILVGSLISAIGLHYFVYTANFAPTGVDGIATMLQSKTQVNAGIYTLALNLPLIILSFVFLDKKFAIYTMISIVTMSIMLIILKTIDPTPTTTFDHEILPAVFSGVLIGIRTGLVLKVGGSSGGVDIIAAIIQKKKPYANIETYIAMISYVIIGVSFFVYDNNIECILLSIIQMFVFEKTVASVMRSKRNAVEFKIVTSDPDLLKNDILSNLKHGATVIHGQGMFTGADKSIILCVVNLRQVPDFMKLLKKYDNLFVYCTNISSVNGNFRWNKDDVAK